LKNKGIKTLGYIFDDSESFANIDYYMKASPVSTDGIFFDNEGSIDNLANFKQYAEYVHSLGVWSTSTLLQLSAVINYIKSGVVDVTNIHEMESSKSHYILVNDNLPPSKISVVLSNITDVQEWKQS